MLLLQKGACGDDAYLLLLTVAFKINYYFVPVHRQKKKERAHHHHQ
jgi:hypothetical protein